MAKQPKRQAVEQRTQQRPVPSEAEGLAARKEAAKKSAETRQRKREEHLTEVAAKHETTLSKLLVRMMEVFEGAAK